MKTQVSIFLAVIIFSGGLLWAQSSFERDLTKLKDQRDKAVEAAIADVDRKYKAELERLLRVSMSSNDLDAALKIKKELASVSDETETGHPIPKNSEELAEFLDGTVWEISNGSPDGKALYTMTFGKGKFTHDGENREGKLEYLGARKFRLWAYDPATLNEEFNKFKAVGAGATYYGRLKERK